MNPEDEIVAPPEPPPASAETPPPAQDVPAETRPALLVRRPSRLTPWRERMRANWRVLSLLVLILALAAGLRFVGLDWDQGTHLDPDERFLTMVETSLQWPSSFSQYLDEAHSPLNPRNVGYNFFVYGTLPTTMIKAVASVLNQSDYSHVYLVGRALSAILDLGSILLVFLLGRLLYRDNRVALLAAFLLSTSVLAIQYAHFMVVDTTANFFIVGALYFLARVQIHGRKRDYIWCGIFFGLALATKVSIYAFAVVVALVAIYRVWAVWGATRSLGERWRRITQTGVRGLLLAIAAFVAFRLGQPDAFRGPGLFDLGLSDRWLSTLTQSQQMVSGNVDFPPNDQWTARVPLWFPWSNMVLWGMGIPLGLSAWTGWGVAGWRLWRRREWVHLIPVAWTGIIFLQVGTQWVKTMRYSLPIYPTLALLAAWLLVWLWDRARRVEATERVSGLLTWTRGKATALGAVVAVGTLLWAVAFVSIYTRPHSRVAASRWIYAHVPPGKAISGEGWDDYLPLGIDGKAAAQYRGVVMNWYDDDTPQKLQQALGWLDQTDYIVESSNRLYGSIPRLPMRYPMTIRYYKALFDGSLGFKKVADIHSYPTLLGIQIPDQGAEEAFTVYDHPLVTIFTKTAAYSRQRAARILGDGIDWTAIVHASPKQVTTIFGTLKMPSAAPAKSLLLTPSEIKANSSGPSYGQEFPVDSLPMRVPALVWLVWLEVLGLLALPLALRLFRRLPDGGFVLAKTVGLLLVGYLTWIAASLHVLRFTTLTILGAAALVGVASLLWGLPLREVRSFVVGKGRLILSLEAIFVLSFAADIVVRMIYPDLWHAWDGNEKPMDFSFLNGLVRSQTMPPADPWFSGGYINYYYYGYFLVATLIKLTGIAPSLAYNLAIPTLLSLTAATAATVGYALTRRLGLGLLAAALTVAAGNLYTGVHVVGVLMAISPVQVSVPVIGGVLETLGGLWQLVTQQLILQHQVFPVLSFRGGGPGSPTNWGWDSTRVIGVGNTINEFPFFSFLIADLHAHVMDLPAMVCCAALATNVALGALPWRGGKRGEVGRAVLPGAGALMLLVTVVVVGATGATNTWDLATALALMALGIAVNRYAAGTRLRVTLISAVLGAAALGIIALGLYSPFYSHLQSFYSQVGFQLAHTALDEWLMVWGAFLFIVTSFVALDLWHGAARPWVGHQVRAIEFLLYYWPRRQRILRLFVAVDAQRRAAGRHVAAPIATLVSLVAGIVLALGALIVQAPVLALALLLLGATLAALLQPLPGASPQRDRARCFTLALALLALGITAACEVAYLADFYAGGADYRTNTVFKLYEQAWPLFAISSAAALATLVRLPRLAWGTQGWRFPLPAATMGIVSPAAYLSGVDERPQTAERPRPGGTPRRLWLIALGLLLIAVALYPLLETPLRLAERPLSTYWTAAGNPRLGPTLDGTAFVQKAFPSEYQALTYLNAHVAGNPTVLSSDRGYYDNFGFRVQWMTGLPGVVQGNWEEQQQRYSGQQGPFGPYPDLISERHADVQTMYSTTDQTLALSLLHKYHVAYVYVGIAERGQPGLNPPSGCFVYGAGGTATCVGYPPAGLAKFDAMVHHGQLTVFYDHAGVTIYRVVA